MKVIDTTVAVDALRGRTEAVALLDGFLAEREPIAASEVVRFELLAGARSDEQVRIEEFCESVDWLPVLEAVSRQAATFARAYRASHSGIDDSDYLIAATALVLDAVLLTTNVRHFPMFEDLEAAY